MRSLPQSLEVRGFEVFGAVDEAEVLLAPALDAGLDELVSCGCDWFGWFDHDSFGSVAGEGMPPVGCLLDGCFVVRARMAAVMDISATRGDSPAARVTATSERRFLEFAYVAVGLEHSHSV